ncbi:ANTAR domain-containing protein [Streptomyces sp. NPDC004074]|uniref:ANTAR domain-containing protein n=1 Tax=Streptomyces sp. NPDC004074 TaxID=3154277 RepID=UPI00339FD32B
MDSRNCPLDLLPAADLQMECERLKAENERLQRAVISNAIVDQAIGVVVVIGQIAPEEAWRVLHDASQRTNIKLRVVAEDVLKFARGGSMADRELGELQRVPARYQACADPAGAPCESRLHA